MKVLFRLNSLLFNRTHIILKHVIQPANCTFSFSERNPQSLSFLAKLFSSSMSQKKEFQRLPGTVIPSNYALKLKPDLNAFTFEGSEEISVEVCTGYVLILLLYCSASEFRYSKDWQYSYLNKWNSCFQQQGIHVCRKFTGKNSLILP